MRDLRDGLSDLSDSGSKRGTSSTGYLMKDWRLLQILAEWERAGGGWPQGTAPGATSTALGVPEEEEPEMPDTIGVTGAFDTSRPVAN